MWLILNNKMKPFDDVRVRQAINYLVPRDEIVKNVYHGMAKAWSGVISDVTPGYENLKPYDFDPDKAKKLLTEAGYADGFEAELLFSAGVPEMENLAVILQSTAGKLGVKLNLKKLPVAAFSDTVQSKKAQMALWIDSPIQPDVNYVVNLVYSTGPLALVNYDQFSDPAVDKLIETGASIVDPKARLEHHKGVQAKIQEGAPMGYTVEPYFRSWPIAKHRRLPLVHNAVLPRVADVVHQVARLVNKMRCRAGFFSNTTPSHPATRPARSFRRPWALAIRS